MFPFILGGVWAHRCRVDGASTSISDARAGAVDTFLLCLGLCCAVAPACIHLHSDRALVGRRDSKNVRVELAIDIDMVMSWVVLICEEQPGAVSDGISVQDPTTR